MFGSNIFFLDLLTNNLQTNLPEKNPEGRVKKAFSGSSPKIYPYGKYSDKSNLTFMDTTPREAFINKIKII